MQYTPKLLSLALLAGLGMSGLAQAGKIADVAIIIDESGSMGGEQAWLPSAISSLENQLVTHGIGDGTDGNNRYALIGFGSRYSGQTGGVGIDDQARENDTWMSAGTFGSATGNLVASGSREDGYSAIDYFLDHYTPRKDAALNVILITDEDRDNTNNTLDYNSILGDLNSVDAMLNVVVNAEFGSQGIDDLLGLDSQGTGYQADGNGGFTTLSGASASSGDGTTIADYVDLALATKGAAWDLNQLRAGGLMADSFSTAFVNIKATEIQQQVSTPATVPLPGTLLLAAVGALGLVATSKRRNPHR
ncbi:hypothetical protein MARPU_02520 [Marichromatium purpuratum 984]|uniref:Ice-binding protein C-terminal domain-containing protein n=1 Tax=Marichromatium purpuratum 984 TaxID=765910 RepID=W0E0W5_MARPU|nr:PEP-CTERM sorting domain-containing protein [Marichromatium purpuratum]AHF02864.1 hypothetical protein MARPU_02520 [Marichromatium purpuratum 984]